MLPRVVPIAEIIPENGYTKTFVLTDTISHAMPGQFIMLWLPGMDEKPFALVATDPLTITVAAVGPFSCAMHDLAPGARVGWRGPFGRGFTINGADRAVLIGGGYGVAALYFAGEQLRAQGAQVIAAIGGRSQTDLLFLGRFRRLGIDVQVATEDGSCGVRGLVTEAAAEPLGVATRILACGPEAMLMAVMKEALTRNIPAELSVERYMKCGFGICGQCTLSGKLVCHDGPVFTAEDLVKLPEFGRVHRDSSGAVHFFQGRGARRV